MKSDCYATHALAFKVLNGRNGTPNEFHIPCVRICLNVHCKYSYMVDILRRFVLLRALFNRMQERKKFSWSKLNFDAEAAQMVWYRMCLMKFQHRVT